MESLNKLHELKESFHKSKKILLEEYVSEIGLAELAVSPMHPDELARVAKDSGQVLYLPPSGFIHDEKSPRDRSYTISDIKFYFKSRQNTQELMQEINKDGYTPFDADMIVTLLKKHPDLIEFFNLTSSSYTDSTIHSKEMKTEDDDYKYWLSAYFGYFIENKIKWRRDQSDLDVNFIIPTYKTLKFDN